MQTSIPSDLLSRLDKRALTMNHCTHGKPNMASCKLCKAAFAASAHANRPLQLWRNARARARGKGLPFSITVTDVIRTKNMPSSRYRFG